MKVVLRLAIFIALVFSFTLGVIATHWRYVITLDWLASQNLALVDSAQVLSRDMARLEAENHLLRVELDALKGKKNE